MIFVYSPCVRFGLFISIGFLCVTRPILQTGLHALVKSVRLEANDKRSAKSVDFSGGFCDSLHIRIFPGAV